MPAHEQEELLFIGDVHIGRRPVGLDEELHQLRLEARALSPVAALEATIDHAVSSPPRAVVFAGDLVDQEEDRFEALAVLERAARKLKDASIPIFVIAGNHDGRILPRLIKRVPEVTLLGAGATWERVSIPGPGRDVDLLGWSFPRNHFPSSPLESGDFARARDSARPGAARLGVLHADLDAGTSDYAPITKASLDGAGLDAWFLGHVHKPSPLNGPTPLGYLGSLVGLDIGEPGPRGAWRVRATEAGIEARQLNLGPVRFEDLEVALDEADVEDEYAVRARIEAALGELAEREDLHAHHSALIARVHLTGQLADRHAVRAFLEGQREGRIVFDEGLPTVLERVLDETQAPIDLAALAEEPTPIGYLASALVAFRKDGTVAPEVQRAFASVLASSWPLDEDTDPTPELGPLFERAAWRALETLLAQEQGGRS